MGTMVDTIQDAFIAESEGEVHAETTVADDSATETQLTAEISTLWSDHVRLSADRKTTGKELRQIRASLAERLHAMKSLLCRPGRGGLWRSWLRERGIPRSTADGLVARYAESLSTDDGNVPTRAISEPPIANAENLARHVWPRAKDVLTTYESVVQFVTYILTASGVAYEQRAEGLVIFKPAPKPADELPGSACATGPDPQPFDEVSVLEDGQAAAADASVGTVM
jgi:hypothetical protein